MDTETTESEVIDTITDTGEGEKETISISKKDYDLLNQTLGSLKREVKDLRKSKEEPVKETPQTKPEENTLLQKTFLRAANITDEEEVELALSTAKKWGLDIDKVVDDDDFKMKLERHRTAKANALATANVKGGSGTQSMRETPEYWLSKGVPPSREDVPDRKTRVKIQRAFLEKAEKGKTFYND